MGYETLLYEEMNHIVKITMNLPETRNPLTGQLVEELVDAIVKADQDPNVRVIVLTGAGKAFSAGADINEFKRNLAKSAPEHYGDGRDSTKLLKLGAEISTPLIASVNGTH